MEYRFERTGAAAIFTLEGRMDSAGSIRIDAAVRSSLGKDDTAVLFDLAGVPYMSSAGIRVLSATEKMLRQRNGHFLLCAVQPSVAKVLEITGFSRIFTTCATREEALKRCMPAAGPDPAGGDTRGTTTTYVRFSAEPFPDHDSVLSVTGSCDNNDTARPDPGDLSPRPFAPDEYSAGTGAPGDTAAEGIFDRGLLVTAGGAIFWKPFHSADPPDFLIPRKDAPRVLLQNDLSLAMDGKFHEILLADPVRPGGVCLIDLLSDIFRHARALQKDCPPVIGTVIYAGIRDRAGGSGGDAAGDSGRGPSDPAGRTLVSTGICIDTAADLSAYDRQALDAIICRNAQDAGANSLFLYHHGLLFDSQPDFSTRDVNRLVPEIIARETCTDLVRLFPDTIISRAVIGVSYITGIVQNDRMPVRIAGECPGWNRTYETITRWLHPGCRELDLVPLTGGFSGTLVFRVRARDSRGRAMMPLVMKLGEWNAIEPEIRGYTEHVKRYIQNNATQIIDTERIGNYGGILYNFVGIRGPESRIFSLEDFYLSRPADEILPVFDALFSAVLQAWYGEPKKKEMALYREYNKFWKYETIRAYAESHFNAWPEMEEIDLPFGLGKSVNPLWFVEKILPSRQSEVTSVYESSVHGDLNMKNVLMDETGNLWLIDFAETRYSHILRDIVKLEAVIKGEMIAVESRKTLEELVLLDARFLSSRSLSQIPDLPDRITDPAMEKAFRCVRNLRRHADRITPGDDDITQYYLALLPFTLNLLSYISVNEYQKEYGWIAASLICRRLVEKSL